MKSVAVSFIMTLVMVSNNSFYLILSTCNKRIAQVLCLVHLRIKF